jgi:hypothetical protein
MSNFNLLFIMKTIVFFIFQLIYIRITIAIIINIVSVFQIL